MTRLVFCGDKSLFQKFGIYLKDRRTDITEIEEITYDTKTIVSTIGPRTALQYMSGVKTLAINIFHRNMAGRRLV